MNWPWIIGGGLFGALAGACLAYPLLMLAMYLDLRRRPATEASDGMAWAPLVAIWLSTVGGLPIGAVGGAYYAWRHPEYAVHAAAPFTLLGGLAAIPLTWINVRNGVDLQALRSDPNRLLNLLGLFPNVAPNVL